MSKPAYVAFNVRVPATLAKQVRSLAKEKEQTLKVVVVNALRDFVEKEQNGNGETR